MKHQLIVSVQNITNDHVHFKRNIEVDGSLVIPYENVVSALLWLYQGLNVKVVIEQSDLYG